MTGASPAEHPAFPPWQEVPFDSTALGNESAALRALCFNCVWNNPVLTSPCCDTQLCATSRNGFSVLRCSTKSVFKFLISCLRVDCHLYVKLESEITSPPFSGLPWICSSLESEADELCRAAGVVQSEGRGWDEVEESGPGQWELKGHAGREMASSSECLSHRRFSWFHLCWKNYLTDV